MKSAEQEMLSVLLGRVLALGLISKSRYQKTVDLLHAGMTMPELLRHPVRLEQEGAANGPTQNTQ